MVGPTLRAAREAQNLSLEQVEQATRIRRKFLEALEDDDFGALPSMTQGRGFLRNYAQFLGLDAHDMLARIPETPLRKHTHRVTPPPHAAAARPQRPEANTDFRSSALKLKTGTRPDPVTPNRPKPPAAPTGAPAGAPTGLRSAALKPKTPANPTDKQPEGVNMAGPSVAGPVISPWRAWFKRTFTADLFVGVMVLLGLLGLLAWGGLATLDVLNGSAATPAVAATPTLPLAANVAPTATPTPSPTVDPFELPTSEPLPTPRTNYTNIVNVVVRADLRLWLRVVADGNEVFVGLLAPGQTREFEGRTFVELTTSNALGLRVIWNGQDQGRLGTLDEVFARTWTQGGMVFPTATPAP